MILYVITAFKFSNTTPVSLLVLVLELFEPRVLREFFVELLKLVQSVLVVLG